MCIPPKADAESHQEIKAISIKELINKADRSKIYDFMPYVLTNKYKQHPFILRN